MTRSELKNILRQELGNASSFDEILDATITFIAKNFKIRKNVQWKKK